MSVQIGAFSRSGTGHILVPCVGFALISFERLPSEHGARNVPVALLKVSSCGPSNGALHCVPFPQRGRSPPASRHCVFFRASLEVTRPSSRAEASWLRLSESREQRRAFSSLPLVAFHPTLSQPRLRGHSYAPRRSLCLRTRRRKSSEDSRVSSRLRFPSTF